MKQIIASTLAIILVLAVSTIAKKEKKDSLVGAWNVNFAQLVEGIEFEESQNGQKIVGRYYFDENTVKADITIFDETTNEILSTWNGDLNDLGTRSEVTRCEITANCMALTEED